MKTIFSECRRYRYTLARQFQGELLLDGCNKMKEGYVNWIMLNPSTADENVDDPTIRRCTAFTKAWGYGSMMITNLFAYRATDPDLMVNAHAPIGDLNDAHLLDVAMQAALVVAAWGNRGEFMNRGPQVMKFIPAQLHTLRLTGRGQPEHPLYLPGDLKPVPWP